MQFRAKPNETVHEHFVHHGCSPPALFTIGGSECFVHHFDYFVHHFDILFTTGNWPAMFTIGFVHHRLCSPPTMFTTGFVHHRLCSPSALFTIDFVHHCRGCTSSRVRLQELRRQQELQRLSRQQVLQRLSRQQSLQAMLQELQATLALHLMLALQICYRPRCRGCSAGAAEAAGAAVDAAEAAQV